MNDRIKPTLGSQIQDLLRPGDVHLLHLGCPPDVQRINAGRVQESIHALKSRCHCRLVEQVALFDFDAIGTKAQSVEPAVHGCRGASEYPDLVSSPQQGCHTMTSDEPSTAGNENSHGDNLP
jgi:hypothetical protein